MSDSNHSDNSRAPGDCPGCHNTDYQHEGRGDALDLDELESQAYDGTDDRATPHERYLARNAIEELIRRARERDEANAKVDAIYEREGKYIDGYNAAMVDGMRWRREKDTLAEALRDFRDNYDHEEDAHRYNNGACRCCRAEAALAKLEAK